jgi:branched-chain amino acid transport system ATP-binding protein
MTALTANGLSKSFGGLRVTDNVDLKVEAGERRLIIGPNGAGKTTLFNLITGEITPDSGAVALLGQDITRIACRRRAHLGLARTYQIITLFPHDTILRNVTLALLGLMPLRWNPLVALDSWHGLADKAHAALARVGLEHIAERPLAQTSYGERRRVEIAMALAQQPKVLLLDEPFGALDALTRASLQDAVAEIHARVGCTVLMITHDVDEAVYLSDRIVMMTNGPSATIGEILDVQLPRPRSRAMIADEPRFNHYRLRVLDFLHTRHAARAA